MLGTDVDGDRAVVVFQFDGGLSTDKEGQSPGREQ
jgi:hypothetical protein